MRGSGAVGGVLAAKLALDDSAHGFALGRGGALPVKAETLVTDGALDVLASGGFSEQNLHDASGRTAGPVFLLLLRRASFRVRKL